LRTHTKALVRSWPACLGCRRKHGPRFAAAGKPVFELQYQLDVEWFLIGVHSLGMKKTAIVESREPIVRDVTTVTDQPGKCC
jgi:hypothetical protein